MQRKGFTFVQFFIVLLVLSAAAVFVFRSKTPDFSSTEEAEFAAMLNGFDAGKTDFSAQKYADLATKRKGTETNEAEFYVAPGVSFERIDTSSAQKPAQTAAPFKPRTSAQKASSGPTVLKDIQIVPIPDSVYHAGGEFSQYLTGDKKRVFMVTLPSCPYARSFRRKLDALFSSSDYKNYYERSIVNVGNSETVFCRNCPKEWLFDHCGEGICIINPQSRQAVIDKSQNAAQLSVLLERFKEW